MSDTLDVLKLRVLLCLLDSNPDDCNVTSIARTLSMEKYAISRVLASLEKMGWVDRSNSRRPALTRTGRQIAARYAERIELTINHLTYEGVDIVSARNDALHWALYNSESTMETIRSSATLYRVKYELREQKSFSGSLLCQKLPDGIYQFPFLIYRDHIRNGNILSMANNGFENPCIISVKDGVGTVQIRAVDITMRNTFGENVRGRVSNLHYFSYGDFCKSEVNGNILSFPASCLHFVNIGSGVGQVLHGSVYLKIESSAGIQNMPVSTAVFTILV